MSLRYFWRYLISILLGAGIGSLLAHRLNPAYTMTSNVIGCLVAVTIVTLRILYTWRACKGDGSCNACPRRVIGAERFEHFCGNHPRITRAIRICYVLLIVCVTGILFIFGHVLGAVLGLIFTEAWEHGSLLFTKLHGRFR